VKGVADMKRTEVQRDLLALLLLMAFGMAVRLPHIIAPYVINTDAIGFIEAAKRLERGGSTSPLLVHPSVFPLLIGWTHSFLIKDWVTAARLLPILFGIATILPLYLLSRELLPPDRVWIPALLYALSPSIVHYSIDVIRDPIFWFWLLGALWCLLRGSRKEARAWIFIPSAGACAVLSCAFRIEGLMLLPLGILILWIRLRGPHGAKEVVVRAVLYLLPAVLVLSAVLLFVPQQARSINPTEIQSYSRQLHRAASLGEGSKQGIKQFIDGHRDRPRLYRFLSAAWKYRVLLFAADLWVHWIRTAYPLFFLLTCIGLFAMPWYRDRGWVAVVLVMVCWLALGYLRTTGAFFSISKRHLVPLAMLGYLLAAQGLMWIRQKLNHTVPFLSSTKGTALLVGLLMVSSLWQVLPPQRQDKLIRRRVGEWIRMQGPPSPTVVTDRPRIAFYAGGRGIAIRNFLKGREKSVHFLVLERSADDERMVAGIEKEVEVMGYSLRLIQTFYNGNVRMEVFRVEEPGRGEK